MASEFFILPIYVDDINLVGTPEELQKAIEYLKKEFEMKDLGKTTLSWSDIAFSVNLLARYNSSPTKRYWNMIKHILRYLKGTLDMSLFYANKGSANLIGYADACYLSDPHKTRYQTGYMFTCGGTVIS
ncbi:secreted RxLR effector protein 161-like [Nicotiana tomentosiformis]|uniref:secreted RxLR effector protein 161-like n=1 Tax=Nicotiana tomentosiformis TaxID=4098 RepID=UPI00388CE93F